jgi:ABC-type uncharacterized transport system substrate-binding protein
MSSSSAMPATALGTETRVSPGLSPPLRDSCILEPSLARPGGNITGLSNEQVDLAGKRLELLREVVPGFRRLAIMANGDT